MGIDPVVMIALSLMLSFVVVDAGLHKLRNPLHYATVISGYRVLPRGSGSPAAIKICCRTKSMPVNFSVSECSTWMRALISLK